MLVSTAWLERRLDQYRDDDMDIQALQDYILALLKREEAIGELEVTVRNELSDFLGGQTDEFVDDLFSEIRSCSAKSSGSMPSSSSNKRSRDRDRDGEGLRSQKKDRRDDGQPAAGNLDYGESLPMTGGMMPFDPSTMASMMNQMLPGAFPPLSYDAAYSYEAQGVVTKEKSTDKEEVKGMSGQKKVEVEVQGYDEEEPPALLQEAEEEAETLENFEDTMRGTMETGERSVSYGRGRGRGRGRGGGRTNFRGGPSWRGGRDNYSTSYVSHNATSKYVKDGIHGHVVSISEPASVVPEASDSLVAEEERDPDDIYGDIDARPSGGDPSSGAHSTASSNATAAIAEAEKKKFEEAKKLRLQSEGVLKQKESVIEAQVRTLRDMITKVDSSTEKGRGQLHMLESKVQDLQNKLKEINLSKRVSSVSASEFAGGTVGGFRGGRGGFRGGRGRGRFIPPPRGRGRGRTSSHYVRGGMARGSGSYVREQT